LHKLCGAFLGNRKRSVATFPFLKYELLNSSFLFIYSSLRLNQLYSIGVFFYFGHYKQHLFLKKPPHESATQ
jgi:hypothetical protein